MSLPNKNQKKTMEIYIHKTPYELKRYGARRECEGQRKR